MERELLKNQLIGIREKDYQLPEDIKAFELVMDMMDYIGDIDGEFRDDIIYSSFVKFALNDKLTNDELYKILDLCLDKNHLFFGIGEVDDKIFTRTFSLLWICVVLYKHINGGFLSKKDLIRVYDDLVRYMHEEKDLRGYVREKGWGHSAAHSADVLAYLTNCKEMEHEELLDILNAVKYRVNTNFYAFINEEDERLVVPVLEILERNLLKEEQLVEWVKGFANVPERKNFPEDLIHRLNVKNYLRCLYFRLIKNQEYSKLTDTAKEVLDQISNFK